MEVRSRISIVGNQSKAEISIPIVNDVLAEGLESFDGRLQVVSWSQPSFESTIHIEIIDDEGIRKDLLQ